MLCAVSVLIAQLKETPTLRRGAMRMTNLRRTTILRDVQRRL
jgi:hypothetical protein